MSFETTPIEENERSTVCCYKWDNHTVMARVLCQMALQHFQSQYLHEKYGTLLCIPNSNNEEEMIGEILWGPSVLQRSRDGKCHLVPLRSAALECHVCM